KLRAAVHLGPAGEARLHVEASALPRRVLVDLVAKRWSRADQAHVAADDVPELRQLVEREPAEGAARSRDARVAAVDGVARALLLGADDHRPQLEQVEVAPLVADAPLPVEDRAAVLELDRERGGGEERACQCESDRAADDIRGAAHRHDPTSLGPRARGPGTVRPAGT